MMALAFVPFLVLPLLFVLQELEQWALRVPEESPGERNRRLESVVGVSSARVRQPRGAR